MRWPLRYQLLLPLLALLLAVVAGSAWGVGVAAQRAARTQIEEQLRNIGTSLSAGRFPLTPAVLEQLKSLTGADYVLQRGDGTRLTTTPAAQDAELPSVAVADTPAEMRLHNVLKVGDAEFIISGLRLSERGAGERTTLFILYPANRWRDALGDAVRPALWLGLAGGVAAVALAIWIAGRLSARVQDLQRQTRGIAAGDFSPLSLPRWNDELRDLALGVNDMAVQLARLQETVRTTERLRLLGQVSGGLAHELRNGVTGARLAVQLHATECHNGADREALDVALRQLTLVESSLQRFLHLGKPGEHRPCDVIAMLKEAIDLLRPRCRHNRIELGFQPGSEACFVDGDAAQLAHLFINVINNALDAAGPGGRVEVRVKLELQQVAVEIWDSGAGPSTDVAERVFEPLVTGKPEGVGLGLAVARQVAEEHGGSIAWRRDDGRTCFAIRLPGRRDSKIGASEPGV